MACMKMLYQHEQMPKIEKQTVKIQEQINLLQGHASILVSVLHQKCSRKIGLREEKGNIHTTGKFGFRHKYQK